MCFWLLSQAKVEEVEMQLRELQMAASCSIRAMYFKSRLSTCTIEMNAGFQQGWKFVDGL